MFVSILILILAVLVMTVSPWSQVYSGDSDKSRPKGDVIFEIGRENGSYTEFTARGFRGKPDYSCRAGVDCTAKTFPEGLYVGEPLRRYQTRCVERVTIYFDLMSDYKEVVLRLARAGDETTEVTVDGIQVYLVTNGMLGSGEH
jgi:hypothetical protein